MGRTGRAADRRWSEIAVPSLTVAFMLTLMAASALVRDARLGAGLSIRALATRADVAYSTVSRIESGQVDPTVGMLTRILDAAGIELALNTHQAPGPPIAALADAWTTDRDGTAQPDWTRLRGFVDHLALHPEQTASATLRSPTPTGSPLMDNILAALAETICDDAGILRPPWTAKVRPLTKPWEQPGTPRMRASARAATPPPFTERGMTLSRSSLWRDRTTVDA